MMAWSEASREAARKKRKTSRRIKPGRHEKALKAAERYGQYLNKKHPAK
jgi:hypothetical protein